MRMAGDAGAGAEETAGAAATGGAIAAAGALPLLLVELADLQPVIKKRASVATERPTGQHVIHFVLFINAYGLCGLRLGFDKKCGGLHAVASEK